MRISVLKLRRKLTGWEMTPLIVQMSLMVLWGPMIRLEPSGCCQGPKRPPGATRTGQLWERQADRRQAADNGAVPV